MKAVTLLLTFTVLVLTASAQNCSNPLITTSGWWGLLSVETTPIDYTPDMSICAASGIADAGKSCCSSDFVSQLTDVWSQARELIEQSVQGFKQTEAEFTQMMKEAKAEIDKDTTMTSQEKSDAKKLLDSVASILSEFIDKIPSYYAKCANYILKYQAGVACFWCNPNWGQFVSGDATDMNKFYFRVAQSNCDSFSSNCVDMVLLTSKMFRRVMDMAADLTNSDSAESGDNFEIFDGCQDTASCKQMICSSNFMGGTGGFMFGGDDGGFSSDSFSARDARMVALQNKLDQVLRPVNNVVRAITTRQQQATIENQYTADGYKAMEVGTATGLSTEISSASSVSSWLALF